MAVLNRPVRGSRFAGQGETRNTVSKTTLHTKDACATTGYREATLEEILAGAKHALSLLVRKGALFTSPRLLHITIRGLARGPGSLSSSN